MKTIYVGMIDVLANIPPLSLDCLAIHPLIKRNRNIPTRTFTELIELVKKYNIRLR